MKITYDKEVDAMYIYFTANKVARTILGPDGLIFDIDAKGSVIGIEILDAATRMENPLSIEFNRLDSLS